MLSMVPIVVFLAACVQSVITSMPFCLYIMSKDQTCDDDDPFCDDGCSLYDLCPFYPFYTCDGLGESIGWPQPLDECVNILGPDSTLTCIDDGTEPETCENYDICQTICLTGVDCDQACATIGSNLNDLGYDDCAALYAAAPDGFEEWGRCFLNHTSNLYSFLTCNADSPSADGTEAEPSDDSDGTEAEPSDESDGIESEPPASDETVPEPCQNFAVCVTICPGSDVCEDVECQSSPLEASGNDDCDALYKQLPGAFLGFEEWGRCFNHFGLGTILTCNEALSSSSSISSSNSSSISSPISSSSSDTDIGMIIGIVVGAVVLCYIIVLVVLCCKPIKTL